MTSSLSKKLQMKPGHRGLLLNAPPGYRAELGALPAGAELVEEPEGPFDLVHLFAQNSDDLDRWGKTAVRALKPDGLLWISYPKKSAGIATDLTRDEGWALITQAGLRPIRQVAINATWSALRFRPAVNESDLLTRQYAGAKAALRPIHDHLVQIAQGLGPDVTLATRNSYVALVRGKQFAVIVPSTKTRLDLGVKLPGKATNDRLQEAKSLGSGSITHKVALMSLADVDDEVVSWLTEAYENVG